MVSAVFDTNVLVSALIRPGRSRELWNRVLEKDLQLVLSPELLSEFDEIISRPQFRRYISRQGIMRFRKILLQNARTTRIQSNFDIVKEDSKDNSVLEAAFDGGADYIVSGDSHLLDLGNFRSVKIVSISQLLEILKQT